MKNELKLKLKLKDIKPNPCHPGIFDEEQVEKLVASLKTAGIMRSFAVFKIDKNYHLVCGHHLHKAAIKVFGKDEEVTCELKDYDEDTADWGMMVENLTQMRIDNKRTAIELKGLKTRLKKRFKDYHAFEEHMKNFKSIAGRIPTGNERKYKDGTRKKGEQHYPQVGSAKFISEWLNRTGEVFPETDIKECLLVIENIAPALFYKIKTGERNRKIKCHYCGLNNNPSEKSCSACHTKLEKKEVFNWTNAVLLASATKDNQDKMDKEKEQQELLNALRNSNEDRIHRVRTRSKLIKKYKELKSEIKSNGIKKTEEEKKRDKEIVKSIRKGEKDISLVELPNTKLSDSFKQKKVFDYNQELIQVFGTAQYKMEDWLKKALPNASYKEIEQIIVFLQGFHSNELKPFIKELVQKMSSLSKNKNSKEFIFEFDKN